MEGFKQVVMDDWAPFITSYVHETLFQLTKYDIIRELGLIWNVIRSSIIVPVLTVSVYLCSVMILMVFVERLYMSGIIYYVMLSGFKPEKRYKFEAINPVEHSVEEQGEVQKCTADYPMVLVQIPMYNERKVYKLSIEAVCRLSWPSDRIIVQVLDDSTDPLIKDLVQIECRRWEKEGINIRYETRIHRNGYKAGALKEGLKHSYVEGCEFVAIFDADFQPEPDYLHRIVPYFIHNPEIGLVQAQWESTNSRECIMTRIQEVSLNFHFKVEQEVGSFAYAFFSFNGTAGVWRLTTIDEAGGWNARTTTEDLDLSLRASLHGWKFVYVSDIKVKSELPRTYKALRYQQHRWSCGPANLFRKMAMDIIRNKRISLWRKIYVIYNFFLVRKMITHIVTFTFFCVIIPTCVMFPEVAIPKWGAVYIPTAITLLNIIETPRSIHLLAFWISLETVMSMTRIKAILIGLLDRKRASEWVVTEKLGDTLLNSNDSNSLPIKLSRKPPLLERIYLMELCMGGFIFFCACYDLAIAKSGKYIYLYVQASAFFICGLGYVGTQPTYY
ncbi:probable glucomannan 4-beta-mannosyltransferase 11 [Papaver somniferum]|uniref:probable glucomannan 4-beta-mannosyltransferase 11 n=1 Tax=Papaver somniferum TaxID=3469 RepID=UPI000E6FF80C|nr:probable glucomannan 4-beta-mannosyltransferase 11 [Papaver somniferum]